MAQPPNPAQPALQPEARVGHRSPVSRQRLLRSQRIGAGPVRNGASRARRRRFCRESTRDFGCREPRSIRRKLPIRSTAPCRTQMPIHQSSPIGSTLSTERGSPATRRVRVAQELWTSRQEFNGIPVPSQRRNFASARRHPTRTRT